MTVSIQAPSGKGEAHAEVKDDSSGAVLAHKQETVEVEPVPGTGPYANVNVHLGKKDGLPNYCSVSYGASLTIPCPPERIDEAFEFAKKWCHEKMASVRASVYEGS